MAGGGHHGEVRLVVGWKVRSAVSEVEAIVMAVEPADVDLRCGARPMLTAGEQPSGRGDGVLVGGAVAGRRYVADASGLELLCTKSGQGELAVGEVPMRPKGDGLAGVREPQRPPSDDGSSGALPTSGQG